MIRAGHIRTARRPVRPKEVAEVVREAEAFPISGHGRKQLLDTAERLFDEEGIDGVSARAIALAAGHRNVGAVSYHFGGKEQLLRAVLARRAEVLDATRHALFDELDSRGAVAPRDALAVTVGPLVALLDDESGRRYLRLLNQAANHPAYYGEADARFTTSIARAAAHLAPLVEHLPLARRQQRSQIVLGMVLFALAQQARLLDALEPPRPVLDTATFTSDLIDACMGALSA